MFRLLNSGMVDVALTNDLDGRIYLRKLGWENDIQPAGEPLATLPLYHYLDNEHQPVALEVGQVIEQLKNSGELERMIAEAETTVISNMLAPAG
jgi:ABC-type amino acid transport substrate-binding protein